MLRILFVGKRYYTNQDALKQRFGRIYRLPDAWARDAHHVSLVLLNYHGYRRELSTQDGFPVHSLPVADPRSAITIRSIARAVSPEVVVASGDCFVGLSSMRLARSRRAKFVFDVYDDYRTFGAYRAFLGWDAFQFIRRHADLVMYASRVMAEEHNLDTSHVLVPNGIDHTVFTSRPISEARKRLDLPPEARFVGYFGSMTPEHGVNVLRRAVQKLRTRRPEIQLLLCGAEHPSTPISGDEVVYRGMVPHRSVPDYMNACDVLALPYVNGLFLDRASSCKIAEYLFCHRPIVATRTPNFVRNFPEQAKQLDALLAAPGDVDALAFSIERQLDKPVIVEPPADISWSQIAARLIARFREIPNRRP